eukprot:jgi/Botrbrau1/19431/Bobra.0338s0055.2
MSLSALARTSLLASCVIQTILGVNQDWDARIANWKVVGGKKPRLRLVELYPVNLFWLSGVIYTIGTILYNIGTTFNLVAMCPGVEYSPEAMMGAGLSTFVVGGVCFLVAGWLLVLEREKGLWPMAIFVPTKKEDWRSWEYWINWCNWWGGVGFCFSGPFLVVPELDLRVYRIENAIGFGLGSLCFLAVGVLICFKLSVAAHGQVQDPTNSQRSENDSLSSTVELLSVS